MGDTNNLPVVTLNTRNVPVTNSRDVAEWFGKRHDNVLQSIDTLLSDDDEDGPLNFQETSYRDAQGKTRRAFEMTQTGFVLLAFGFTGKEALKFKKAYIARFNAMEAELVARDRAEAQKTAERLAQIEQERSVMTVLEYMVSRKERWPNAMIQIMRHDTYRKAEELEAPIKVRWLNSESGGQTPHNAYPVHVLDEAFKYNAFRLYR